jgi:hypothetical protein
MLNELDILRYRRMLMERSGAERMAMGSAMFDAARAIVLASLSPDLTDREIRIALLERLYGCDLDEAQMRGVRERL